MKIPHKFIKSEQGRSMVEILGVLAVIGVLSIGGIQGYRYAFTKYRANDIVNAVNMRASDIYNRFQAIQMPEEADFSEWSETTETGFPIFIEKMPNGYDTIITERADNISAGQKQLLCIARIMLLKPPMMKC